MFVTYFPVYVKFADTNSFPATYPIICDSALYNRLKEENISYTWSGVRIENPVKTVNDYLNSKVISDALEFITITKPVTGPILTPISDLTDMLNFCGIRNRIETVSDNVVITSAGYYQTDYVTAINNDPINITTMSGVVRYSDSSIAYGRFGALGNNINRLVVSPYGSPTYIRIELNIYPDDIITTGYNTSKYPPTQAEGVQINIEIRLHQTSGEYDYANYISVTSEHRHGADSPMYRLEAQLHDFNTANSLIDTDDLENPYGEDGNSQEGGGDGTLPHGSLDFVDATEVPDIPSVTSADCGFMTMYNPTKSQLQALSQFLWSGAFDLDTYKKLFSDPMESIIGLAIVPVAPSIAGQKNVMFGSIDSGVNMPYLSTQYVKLNCGSLSVDKYIGCFMDYAPYTKISIYLPYIGIRDLSPDDITGGSISVSYIVDVLTGACACFISHSAKGVLYSYNGSCISNIPLTAQNFSGAIQNAVSAVISGVGMVAGMASGAAPLTAMSASAFLNSAANTALNSKPHIQRSGNLGGSAGIMAVQKPFLIIERPNLSVPNNVQHYVGQTSNLTRYLSACKGFTMVEHIHLHGIDATSDELKEIESLLKEGVIL